MRATHRMLATGRMVAGLALVVAAGQAGAQSSQGVRPVVANVQGGAPEAAAPQAALNPPSAVPLEPAGNTLLAELRELVEQRAVRELRTTYNGHYGASLLFKPDDLTYYVALFQQRQFWRAIKTQDYAQAEKLYRSFADQTESLARVDIDRIRLDAERLYTESRIQSQSAELDALRNNLAYQRERERQVVVAQEQAREQASALAAQEQAARERLEALQRSISALERQQSSMLEAAIAPPPDTPRARR